MMHGLQDDNCRLSESESGPFVSYFDPHKIVPLATYLLSTKLVARMMHGLMRRPIFEARTGGRIWKLKVGRY
jgi:hypothetical protein